jgi:hypothetical protein
MRFLCERKFSTIGGLKGPLRLADVVMKVMENRRSSEVNKATTAAKVAGQQEDSNEVPSSPENGQFSVLDFHFHFHFHIQFLLLLYKGSDEGRTRDSEGSTEESEEADEAENAEKSPQKPTIHLTLPNGEKEKGDAGTAKEKVSHRMRALSDALSETHSRVPRLL